MVLKHRDDERDDEGGAQDDGQRIVVDVTGLEPAQERRGDEMNPPDPVDGIVDDPLVEKNGQARDAPRQSGSK